MSAIVRKETIDELCAHRARAIELYAVTVARLDEACDAHRRACQIGGHASTPHLAPDRNGYGVSAGRPDDVQRFLAEMTRRVDRDIWRGIITGTPIGSLMDAQERRAFQESLDKDPPPATVENVRATLERLIGESDTIFRRGLVNAFKALNREYASNDGFKIGERIVLTWGVTWDKIMSYFTLHSRREGELQDIDRVMHVLDGKPAPEYQQGLCAALRGHCYSAGRDKGTIGVTPYWRYRIFKNGNIHLWPLRRDLLDRVNRIIAEHFGLVVPAGRDARQSAAAPEMRSDANLPEDFFPTPPAVVERLVELAEIEPGHAVLEPSAGEGAIVQALAGLAASVECIELNPARCEALRGRRPDGSVTQGDFLSVSPQARFDRIVMNPPFAKRQDVFHVLHATKFLRPGGRLVAVMGAGVTFRDDRIGQAFRQTFEAMGGTMEELPEGSFRESGTSVRTVVVTLEARA